MAAASVLLGLTPTILSNLGPTIAEIALLSSQRPLLSLLLSMGAPVTYPSRFLEFKNPFDLLRRPDRPSTLKITFKPSRFAIEIAFFQYLLAILAIVNLLATSWEMGRKSVLSWRCSVSWLPLMWAITPIACYAPAVWSFELYRRNDASQKDLALRRTVRREFTISACNTDTVPIHEVSKQEQPGAWSIILQSTSSLFVILQIVFGTAVFSSLLYIGVEDATILLFRFAISAFICRVIMYSELEGMIMVVQKQEEDRHSDRELDDYNEGVL